MNKTDVKKTEKKVELKPDGRMKKDNLVVALFQENTDSLLYTLKQYLIERIIEIYPNLDKGLLSKTVHLSKPTVESFGDYSTNIALVYSGQLKTDPREIAAKLTQGINDDLTSGGKRSVPVAGQSLSIDRLLERAEVAGAGFVNLFLSPIIFSTSINSVLSKKNAATITQSIGTLAYQNANSRKIMIEFAHPNTHKEFHIGHLRNISIGESLVRILEALGATIFRANYEGDVGMHVAKAIFGVYQKIKDEKGKVNGKDTVSDEEILKQLRTLTPAQKAKFLGEAYALGSKMADENEDIKKEIIELNKQIYKDPTIAGLWEETRGWSLEYFETIYKRLGTHFDRLFFESEVERSGRQLVIDNIQTGIFIKDKDGSIYFPGENYGLNNCVFVTKEDYATYEGKEVGLEDLEYRTFPFDLEIHVVANEQINFFQIAFEAVAQVFPYQRGRQYHLAYGMVKLKGAKLSSRTGQVVTADFLIDEAKERVKAIIEESGSRNQESGMGNKEVGEVAEIVAVAAVKYSMLRANPLMDIQFDLEESVTFDGDSGPYLLYTYARARSVLRKSEARSTKSEINHNIIKVDKNISHSNLLSASNEEKSVVGMLYSFPDVVAEAGKTLSPNLIASYLFDLAQKYNLFYNKHTILGNSETKDFRLALTQATATILKSGLYLLGIQTVERM